MIAVRLPCDEAAILSGVCRLRRPTKGGWVLAATILGSSLAFIDGTVVNVALPAMQSALHAKVTDVQWVIESYALLLSSLLLLGGALGDMYGRARIFALGLVVFALGSAWCGLAPSIGWLIVARGFQGVGAALLVPGSLALLSASFPEPERNRAIGTWSGFTSITTALGPVLGGWLIQHASWRWVFFINIPIAMLALGITLWGVPESRDESASRRLDWPGAMLVAPGLGAITFALIEAPRGGLAVSFTTLLGVAGLLGFLVVEARSASPMVPLSLFRSRNFTAANLLTFCLYAALNGALFFLPLDLIQIQHYSATQAGAALLPFILLMFLLSRWSGGLLNRFGPQLPLTVGPVITAVAFGLLLRGDNGGTFWTAVFPGIFVLGIGMTISVAPLTATVMDAVLRSQAGLASGINNAVSRTAGLLAVAVFGLMLYTGFNRDLDRRLDAIGLLPAERHQVDQQRPKLAAAEDSDPRVQLAIEKSFVTGYHVVLWTAMTLSFIAALSALAMVNRSPVPVNSRGKSAN